MINEDKLKSMSNLARELLVDPRYAELNTMMKDRVAAIDRKIHELVREEKGDMQNTLYWIRVNQAQKDFMEDFLGAPAEWIAREANERESVRKVEQPQL